MKTSCNINDSFHCLHFCNDRICSKVPIIQLILLSGDKRKINNLTHVMDKYNLTVKDYL